MARPVMLPLALILAGTGGAIVGCVTGLLPGLHVNTLAVLLVAAAPAVAAVMAGLGLDASLAPFLVAAFVLAITISHTFVNIIPATYLGAPDESTALSVLPAHRMLLRGHGVHAVRISAYASFFGLVLSLVLIPPAYWLLVGPPQVWHAVRSMLPWILLVLVVFLLLREPARIGPGGEGTRRALGRLAGLNLFLASGIFGLLAFRLPYQALVPMPASPLLPMLSGLFGAATLLEALSQNAKIPHQFLRLGSDRLQPRGAASALGVGVAAGTAMSLLPGLTNATATAVAGAARRAAHDGEILVSLGAVNTANAVFNLVVLYLFERARSGAVVALDQLWPVEPWAGTVPADLVWFLFVALAAGLVSLVATLAIGRYAARRIHVVPYRRLVLGVLAYMALVVVIFSGFVGFLVFLVGAALGMVPVRLGLQRTHLTGVLLVPVLSYLLWPA